MLLLVGLGNIGDRYEHTRHNLGFLTIDELAHRNAMDGWKHEKKFFGKVCPGQINQEKIIFLKPDTYMNLSGKSVGAVARFYKIPLENVWLFFDDLDLPFGSIRFREKGSAGGHNGIKSIIQSLGSQNFARIKMGISNTNRQKIPAEKFVLQKFTPEEKSALPVFINEALEVFLSKIRN